MARNHEDALSIHKGAYVSSSDPGAVGAQKLWVDTSSGPPFTMKVRNAGNSAWQAVGGAGGATEVYVQGTDPGAVGYGKLWVDDSGAPPFPLTVRDSTDTTWVVVDTPTTPPEPNQQFQIQIGPGPWAGVPTPPGRYPPFFVPMDCTIQGIRVVCLAGGGPATDTYYLRIAKGQFAAPTPVTPSYIDGGAFGPTADISFEDYTLTGWTTALLYGDLLYVDVMATPSVPAGDQLSVFIEVSIP